MSDQPNADVFIDSQSMNILVNAVASTSFSQPIPERLAAAFADVGPSMAGALLGELVLAAIILSTVEIAIWKEITAFSVVVLVVDAILEQMFFAPVLSIDIQRLELSDLIRQSPGRPMPSTPSDVRDPQRLDDDASGFLFAFLSSCYTVSRARPARTLTFATLIGINVILYASYGVSGLLLLSD